MSSPCFRAPAPRWRRPPLWALTLWTALLPGCAAITNPLVDSPPVKNTSPALAPPPCKNLQESIPLSHLQPPPPDAYRLDAGDVLGVWVDGVIGDRKIPIPVYLPQDASGIAQRLVSPSAGYPFRVQEDGTLHLPMIDPVNVRGLTVTEADLAVRAAYQRRRILPEGAERVFVTLLQKRTYEVVVLRQEATRFATGAEGAAETTGKRGFGFVVNLAAYENDVLHALALTGGLPGLDAENQVTIVRGLSAHGADRQALLEKLRQLPPGAPLPPELAQSGLVLRIPLRQVPGEPLPFRPQDVILQSGDVVYLEARDKDVFYTAGLLPTGEHILPRDRDLDVLTAVSLVRGPLVNSTFGGVTLGGAIIPQGLGQPSASLLVVLRRTPGGGQVPIRVDLNRALRDVNERITVRPGDLLVLQERPTEALLRYASQTFANFNLILAPIHTRWLDGIVDIMGPDRIQGRSTFTAFQPFIQPAAQIQSNTALSTGNVK
jgi:protein involved in polysaccharide export with SLBB domain